MVSIILHILIGAVLLIRIGEDIARVLDAGARGAGTRGGGGGGAGRETYISLPAPAASTPKAVAVEPPKEAPVPVPVTPTPTPPPVVPPPVQEEQPVAVASAATAPSTDSIAGRGPGQGGGEGGGTGGGAGPGTGAGRGPGEGTGGGEGGTGRAPRPRFELIPPTDAPKELRGKEILVLFAIDAQGKVRKVTFDPELPKIKYSARLREAMEGYRFHPALGPDGTAVPGTFEITVSF